MVGLRNCILWISLPHNISTCVLGTVSCCSVQAARERENSLELAPGAGDDALIPVQVGTQALSAKNADNRLVLPAGHPVEGIGLSDTLLPFRHLALAELELLQASYLYMASKSSR